MTNDDVIKLTKAGLGEETIVLAVKNAPETDFDTSSDGLIALTQAGVSGEIVNAMLTAGQPEAAAPAGPGANAAVADQHDPQEITLITDDAEQELLYTSAQMRTAARAFGFGGVATYAVLRGSNAQLRITDTEPEFIIAAPGRAQPDAYAQLASFAIRGNGSREVLVGGGYMSYSTGIHPDRIMPISFAPLEDQSKAPEGFTLYRIKTTEPLAPGEYAVVFYSSEVALPGMLFGGGNAYFDFGIDPQ
ncbi:MAG: hypothetical protein E1N59_604 [Puniceicoccaceae bacterium 5H]|nr:MAG: hypothetical protein E1N59_604 [Puniceicoccaceae bacterium 5H]